MLQPRILSFGGCVVDRLGQTLEAPARLRTSNIGRLATGFGGAARNVAENLTRLGRDVTLVTRVADDEDGRQALRHLRDVGVRLDLVPSSADDRTASYTAIFDGAGALVIGLADMDILAGIGPDAARAMLAREPTPAMVFMDANLSPATLEAIAATRPALLAAGPVSEQKALRLRPILPAIDVLFLNRFEAASLTGQGPDDVIALADGLVALGAKAGVVTADADGVCIFDGPMRSRQPAPPATIVNVNGAGDALAGATISGLLEGLPLVAAVRLGLAAAALTVECGSTVSPLLNPLLLETRLRMIPS